MGRACRFDESYFSGGAYGRFGDSSTAVTELAHWYAGVFRLLNRRFGHRYPILGRAVELGAGHGAVLDLLERQGLDPVATDLSAYVLGEQRAIHPQRPLTTADASALPFREESFDTLLSFEVVEHLPDPNGAFREMVRVLRPGGVLVATTPNPAADRWPLFDSARDPTHISVQSVATWEAAAAAAGLADQTVVTYLQVPFLWRRFPLARRVIRTGRHGPSTLILGRKG